MVDSNSEEESIQKKKQVVGLLQSAGYALKKWSSNSVRVLEGIPLEDRPKRPSFDPKDDHALKVLGLHWDPSIGTFGYHTHNEVVKPKKRGVLSAIAKLYDPIGTLGPTLLYAKVIMQQLWKSQFDWDTPLPHEPRTAWSEYVGEMPFLRHVKIARHVDISQYKEVQLIGFCDASQKGYAGMVYLRVMESSGTIKTYLLTCKQKWPHSRPAALT